MVLVVGSTTKNDTDFVPHEIKYAVDECEIPLIVAYTGYNYVLAPAELRKLWPKALAERIDNGTAKAIHIAFRRPLIDAAIAQFNLNNPPKGSLVYYTEEYQKRLGIEI
jgi:hypothetical protein